MAKKKIEEEVEVIVPEEVEKVVEDVVVSPLTPDFHDETLNLIRDKINEIIAKK